MGLRFLPSDASLRDANIVATLTDYRAVKYFGDHVMNNESPFSPSIMKTALTFIGVLIALGIVGAILSGGGTIISLVYLRQHFLAMQGVITFGMFFFYSLIMILLLFILRCFVLCMDSIEKAVRRIEYLINKDGEPDE